MKSSYAVLAAACFVTVTIHSAEQEPADLILHHGKIVTVDRDFSIRQAVVIRDGLVLAIGGNDLLERFKATNSVDLKGRTVIPGFDDTHIHISGNSRRWIDLAGVTSVQAIKQKVSAKASELGPGEWITGYGWSEDELAERRRPLRSDLDEAAPANPTVLDRAGGHSAVANSLALKLAGITRGTPDPASGVIEHDAAGELNGIIRERQDLVSHLVPTATPEEKRDSFVQNLRDLLALGITSLVEAGVTPEDYREWETVYAAHGTELPRASVQIYWAGPDKMRAFGKKSGDGDERLRVGAVKLLVDGGFTGPAAYTLDDYKGQPGYRGKLNYTEQELYDIVKASHAMGWQMGFHTIGDGAIKLTTDIFARVLAESPRLDHRHYLNHFSMMPPEDTLRKLAANHILVAQQPNFTYTLEGRYAANLEGTRLEHNNPLRSVLDHGIFLAIGSDILPIGPMVGVYAAVTRKGMSGTVYGAEERLTMPEALRAYTHDAAYITREEGLKGSIEPGRLADLAVLSDDLLTIPPERIRNTTVDLTVVGGRIVFERKKP